MTAMPVAVSSGRGLPPLFAWLLVVGLVGIHAVDLDEGSLHRMQEFIQLSQPSAFEILLRSTEGEGPRRKLQEVVELQHWTEVLYGVPYSDETTWVDPHSDASKPVTWGLNDQGQTAEENAREKEHRGRFLAEEAERRILKNKGKSSLGLKAVASTGPSVASVNGSYFRYDSTDVSLLTSVDWRLTNAITVIKYQGSCSSCWAIAAADTMTMLDAISNGDGQRGFNMDNLKYNGDAQFSNWGNGDVSVQEICDCGSLGSCCTGGWPEVAFQYATGATVSSWQDYPYRQKDGSCNVKAPKKKFKPQITGWEWVPARNPLAAKKTVANQPFLAFISASSTEFQTYLGGLFTGNCNGDLNHVVTVVGYGISTLGPYWLIKNSWGASWGDSGYMYLSAAVDGAGPCNIFSSPGMYPVNFPINDNPCNSLPNPCGAGTCFRVTSDLGKQYRCGCPAGYVEYNQTNPAKCVRANPCSSNPNPCGSGTCTDLQDGSFSCSCAPGFKASSLTDGAPTCSPNNVQGGTQTVTVGSGTTPQDVATSYGKTVSSIVTLNPWVASAVSALPAGAVLSIADPGSTNTASCGSTYIVQGPDTWDSLATQFSTPVGQLYNLNPLFRSKPLVVGTEICTSLRTSSVVVPPTCGQTRAVLAGETCLSIALASGLSNDLFTRLNYAVKCNQPLPAGIIVCTAAGGGPAADCTSFYTVQHGDTCPTIQLSNDLTSTQLKAVNPGLRCSSPYLQVGQVLCVDAPSLSSNPTAIPYTVKGGDTLGAIAEIYFPRCGQDSSTANICLKNNIPACGDSYSPPANTLLQIPCTNVVGRSCGCAWDYSPYFGADGVWYQNYCDANCNFALPAISYQDYCRRACMNRAGLAPYNDPNGYCSNPCPWPQWNPQPANWWWFASSFSGYYIGACEDWCSSSASTICNARGDCGWNWGNYYNGCVGNCRAGKC